MKPAPDAADDTLFAALCSVTTAFVPDADTVATARAHVARSLEQQAALTSPDPAVRVAAERQAMARTERELLLDDRMRCVASAADAADTALEAMVGDVLSEAAQQVAALSHPERVACLADVLRSVVATAEGIARLPAGQPLPPGAEPSPGDVVAVQRVLDAFVPLTPPSHVHSGLPGDDEVASPLAAPLAQLVDQRNLIAAAASGAPVDLRLVVPGHAGWSPSGSHDAGEVVTGLVVPARWAAASLWAYSDASLAAPVLAAAAGMADVGAAISAAVALRHGGVRELMAEYVGVPGAAALAVVADAVAIAADCADGDDARMVRGGRLRASSRGAASPAFGLQDVAPPRATPIATGAEHEAAVGDLKAVMAGTALRALAASSLAPSAVSEVSIETAASRDHGSALLALLCLPRVGWPEALVVRSALGLAATGPTLPALTHESAFAVRAALSTAAGVACLAARADAAVEHAVAAALSQSVAENAFCEALPEPLVAEVSTTVFWLTAAVLRAGTTSSAGAVADGPSATAVFAGADVGHAADVPAIAPSTIKELVTAMARGWFRRLKPAGRGFTLKAPINVAFAEALVSDAAPQRRTLSLSRSVAKREHAAPVILRLAAWHLVRLAAEAAPTEAPRCAADVATAWAPLLPPLAAVSPPSVAAAVRAYAAQLGPESRWHSWAAALAQ